MLNESLGLNKDIHEIAKAVKKAMDTEMNKDELYVKTPENGFDIKYIIVKRQSSKVTSGEYHRYKSFKDDDGKWVFCIGITNDTMGTITHEIQHGLQHMKRGMDAKGEDHRYIQQTSDSLNPKHKKIYAKLAQYLYFYSLKETECNISLHAADLIENGVGDTSLMLDILNAKEAMKFTIDNFIKNNGVTQKEIYQFIRALQKYKWMMDIEPDKIFTSIWKIINFLFMKPSLLIGKNMSDSEVRSKLKRYELDIRKYATIYYKKLNKLSSMIEGEKVTNREEAERVLTKIGINGDLMNNLIATWEEIGYPKSKLRGFPSELGLKLKDEQ